MSRQMDDSLRFKADGASLSKKAKKKKKKKKEVPAELLAQFEQLKREIHMKQQILEVSGGRDFPVSSSPPQSQTSDARSGFWPVSGLISDTSSNRHRFRSHLKKIEKRKEAKRNRTTDLTGLERAGTAEHLKASVSGAVGTCSNSQSKIFSIKDVEEGSKAKLCDLEEAKTTLSISTLRCENSPECKLPRYSITKKVQSSETRVDVSTAGTSVDGALGYVNPGIKKHHISANEHHFGHVVEANDQSIKPFLDESFRTNSSSSSSKIEADNRSLLDTNVLFEDNMTCVFLNIPCSQKASQASCVTSECSELTNNENKLILHKSIGNFEKLSDRDLLQSTCNSAIVNQKAESACTMKGANALERTTSIKGVDGGSSKSSTASPDDFKMSERAWDNDESFTAALCCNTEVDDKVLEVSMRNGPELGSSSIASILNQSDDFEMEVCDVEPCAGKERHWTSSQNVSGRISSGDMVAEKPMVASGLIRESFTSMRSETALDPLSQKVEEFPHAVSAHSVNRPETNVKDSGQQVPNENLSKLFQPAPFVPISALVAKYEVEDKRESSDEIMSCATQFLADDDEFIRESLMQTDNCLQQDASGSADGCVKNDYSEELKLQRSNAKPSSIYQEGQSSLSITNNLTFLKEPRQIVSVNSGTKPPEILAYRDSCHPEESDLSNNEVDGSSIDISKLNPDDFTALSSVASMQTTSAGPTVLGKSIRNDENRFSIPSNTSSDCPGKSRKSRHSTNLLPLAKDSGDSTGVRHVEVAQPLPVSEQTGEVKTVLTHLKSGQDNIGINSELSEKELQSFSALCLSDTHEISESDPHGFSQKPFLEKSVSHHFQHSSNAKTCHPVTRCNDQSSSGLGNPSDVNQKNMSVTESKSNDLTNIVKDKTVHTPDVCAEQTTDSCMLDLDDDWESLINDSAFLDACFAESAQTDAALSSAKEVNELAQVSETVTPAGKPEPKPSSSTSSIKPEKKLFSRRSLGLPLPSAKSVPCSKTSGDLGTKSLCDGSKAVAFKRVRRSLSKQFKVPFMTEDNSMPHRDPLTAHDGPKYRPRSSTRKSFKCNSLMKTSSVRASGASSEAHAHGSDFEAGLLNGSYMQFFEGICKHNAGFAARFEALKQRMRLKKNKEHFCRMEEELGQLEQRVLSQPVMLKVLDTYTGTFSSHPTHEQSVITFKLPDCATAMHNLCGQSRPPSEQKQHAETGSNIRTVKVRFVDMFQLYLNDFHNDVYEEKAERLIPSYEFVGYMVLFATRKERMFGMLRETRIMFRPTAFPSMFYQQEMVTNIISHHIKYACRYGMEPTSTKLCLRQGQCFKEILKMTVREIFVIHVDASYFLVLAFDSEFCVFRQRLACDWEMVLSCALKSEHTFKQGFCMHADGNIVFALVAKVPNGGTACAFYHMKDHPKFSVLQTEGICKTLILPEEQAYQDILVAVLRGLKFVTCALDENLMPQVFFHVCHFSDSKLDHIHSTKVLYDVPYISSICPVSNWPMFLIAQGKELVIFNYADFSDEMLCVKIGLEQCHIRYEYKVIRADYAQDRQLLNVFVVPKHECWYDQCQVLTCSLEQHRSQVSCKYLYSGPNVKKCSLKYKAFLLDPFFVSLYDGKVFFHSCSSGILHDHSIPHDIENIAGAGYVVAAADKHNNLYIYYLTCERCTEST